MPVPESEAPNGESGSIGLIPMKDRTRFSGRQKLKALGQPFFSRSAKNSLADGGASGPLRPTRQNFRADYWPSGRKAKPSSQRHSRTHSPTVSASSYQRFPQAIFSGSGAPVQETGKPRAAQARMPGNSRSGWRPSARRAPTVGNQGMRA